MSFEERYRELEEILARLERGDLTLDASLADYEKGVAALRACRDLLAQAERRIEELSAPTPGDGGPAPEPAAPERGGRRGAGGAA